MHLHILGICGTFMAGIAVLAKQQGHHVTGADSNVYPPMSDQLRAQGIVLQEGYDPQQLRQTPDIIIVGNAMKRGNPAIEYMLDRHLPYTSGPQWLAENILRERWVLAVAGTHGKTTTSGMLAWILEAAGLQPGFLIGGVAQNFGVSARLGAAPFFVIEADEYDSAFFDKRSKFIHYQARTLILNNLEYDHADIFPDLAAIQTQCHHLVRTIPNNGLIICPANDQHLAKVLAQGCWTPITYIDGDHTSWQARDVVADGSAFAIYYADKLQGNLQWNLLGLHNVHNALAAIAAARHAGVPAAQAISALSEFRNAKRRLEILWQKNDITIYDDFAHHPTAIATTLAGLRQHVGATARIIAVVELGSYTMRTGVHRDTLAPALQAANRVLIARPQEDWGVTEIAARLAVPATVHNNVEDIIHALQTDMRTGDHIVIMSNSGFDGIHAKLLAQL
jgi:UDP-N-acetylmuramate: L-alanyl-gamma-D-glutamyl-meso-diaminopimelate ligase